jgi:pilus assembly protein Flp/PilA
MANLLKFFRDESGATAVEYALITAVIGMAIVAALSYLANGMVQTLSDLQQTVNH